MDPSVIKLLEEDEDESMYAGADVDALTEALIRDIQGNDSTNPMASDRDSGILSQGGNSSTLNSNLQFFGLPPQSERFKKLSSCYQNQHIDSPQLQYDHILLLHGNTPCNSVISSQQTVVNSSTSQDIARHSKEQQHKFQQFNHQQTPNNTNLLNNLVKWRKQTSSMQLDKLVPKLQPLLDKDRSMQLRALYVKLLKNEISKENFLQVCKNIVGDRMIREAAIHQLQMQARAQAAWQWNQRQNLSHAPAALECKIDAKGGHGSVVNNEVFSKVPMKSAQQHLPTVQTLFSTYASSIQAQAYPMTSIATTSAPLKLQNQSLQMRQSTINPSISSLKAMTTGDNELLKAVQNHKKMHDGYTSQMLNQVARQQLSSRIVSQEPNCSQIVGYVGQGSMNNDSEYLKKPQFSVPRSSFASIYENKGPETLKDDLHGRDLSDNSSSLVKTAGPEVAVTNSIMQKPLIGKKKALESFENSPQQARKKQKIGGAFLEQSIEQLNDVTTVSGINLREEEQLLIAPTEEKQVPEAIQRVVGEEQERSILQKGPLLKKLSQIISKCGLGVISNDVENCLSTCVGERLRSFIGNLIRLSKQRVDIEKRMHKVVVTSDVRRQILAMEQKAKKERENKQAEESEKSRKLNCDLAEVGTEDKDDRPSKKQKCQREEDDKLRTTAANAAARAAIGVDDILSKWQIMAEQARKNRETKLAAASGHPQSSSIGENQPEDGGMSGRGRSTGISYNSKIDRTICIKDVIAALEKEPMMSRSSLLYRLYERTPSSFDAG